MGSTQCEYLSLWIQNTYSRLEKLKIDWSHFVLAHASAPSKQTDIYPIFFAPELLMKSNCWHTELRVVLMVNGFNFSCPWEMFQWELLWVKSITTLGPGQVSCFYQVVHLEYKSTAITTAVEQHTFSYGFLMVGAPPLDALMQITPSLAVWALNFWKLDHWWLYYII